MFEKLPKEWRFAMDRQRTVTATAQLACLVVTLLLPGSLGSKCLEQPRGSLYKASLRFDVNSPDATTLVVLTVLLPSDIAGLQRVRSIKYSEAPKDVFDIDGTRYAQFAFVDPRAALSLSIDLEVELLRCDYSSLQKKTSPVRTASTDSLRPWVAHELYLERHSPKVIAAAMAAKGPQVTDRIREHFDFVLKTLRVRGYEPTDYGAVWALNHEQGDCTEFADLFVAMCRASGIPARVCEGYLLDHGSDTPKHAWAEVYIDGLGWVPFDPFLAEKGKATFEKLAEDHLLLDVHRQTALLNGSHFWSFRYEGPNPVTISDRFLVEPQKR